MKKSAQILPLVLFSLPILANPADNTEQKLQNVAKPQAPQKSLPDATNHTASKVVDITEAELLQNYSLTQHLLSEAIYTRQAGFLSQILTIYQKFPQRDLILEKFAQAKLYSLSEQYSPAIALYREILAEKPDLNAVRVELAILLFRTKQNNAALDQFNKAKSVENLPAPVADLIDAYTGAINKQDEWQFGASVYYVNTHNVNNTSDATEIENTGYVKGEGMKPRSAKGFGFNADISRDFNLFSSHYLSFENNAYGKIYWNSHEDDDISNRTLLGYSYKTVDGQFRLLPFFEKRSVGNQSYRRTRGLRAEWNYWFNPNWQVSTALEYGKQNNYDSTAQDGSTKLASATLLWLRNPQQFFYLGSDFNREDVKVKQYSSDTKSVRLGWGQEWNLWGLSTRLNLSFMKRDYKDIAKLGGFLSLGKVREDKVYSSSLTLWKRDWHLWNITPKLQFSWKKYDSNLPTLYSYTDKNINLLFETRF